MVTVISNMPVGSNVGFHYHPGYAFVVVIKGGVPSFDSAECEASDAWEAGEAFLDLPGHKHDIVNVGDEPAQFVVTFSSRKAKNRSTRSIIRAKKCHKGS